MQLHFITLKIFIIILLAQPVFSQCFITNCPNPVILTGDANWVNGTQGSTNGVLSITGISLGNVDCIDGGVGIEIYIYQLLPDGSRVSLCDVANAQPNNFVYKVPIGVGPASDCTDTGFPLPDIQIYDHQNDIGGPEMFLCEGGVYEVIMVAYVRDADQTLPDEESVFSALNAGQYIELNLGSFFVNYTNEFSTPDPYPNPITTAVITGPNGETGMMQANCGEDVSLFFEGLSYIGRCRFDEDNLPNFYTFCDPSDPNMTEGTYSPSITSETETFLSYTVNGGTPVVIRNGNGGDSVTDAYGGQQTGPGNLPGLGENECYTGVCGARAIPAPESVCDGDVIVVTLQTLDVYTGNIIEDQMTITYSGDACNSCQPICPTEANITASLTEICSGESIAISGSTVGEGEATFTITESSGAIAEINEGVELILPENNTCAPVTYTFNATATCTDGDSEITNGILSVDVTVYPADISAFVTANGDECSTSVTIDASCGTNISINPSETQTANPGESGTHNYTASWTGGGSSCASDLNLTATYNCPPDIVCPTEANIVASSTEICSGESITISGSTMGEGSGTFTITESTGVLAEITEGVEFTLPENNTCAPVTYTFNAIANCVDDGSEITNGTLSVDVIVYPSDISAFVSTNDGECSTSISVDANCGTSLTISPSESQTANPGESGTHNYTVSWSGEGSSCVSDINLSATYNCPPDIVCPSSADINASATEVCSGESITISGTSTGEGSANFTITGTGIISAITEGVPFSLPENNTCAPVTYTFNATATCADDGSEITNGTLSIDVTVYPSDISAFVTASDGECSTSVSLDASCGINLTISPSENQTANAGESGTHNYTASWSGGGSSCVSDLNISATYNCPPDIVCPSMASINASATEICSGESITISGTSTGEGSANFAITSTGVISAITEGVPFLLPENNTCTPATYTFNATATCADDGSEITNGTLSVDVTVYPSDISAFVTANDGECSTSVSVDASCGINLTINPSQPQTANPGESGTHNYTASWTAGGSFCASDLNLSATYNCPPDISCPSTANINSSATEICSGESITVNGTSTGEGSANFIITSTGIISAITEGVPFSLPENNTCAPVTYTFNATATCADDGSDITNGTLSVEVTVYPSDISAFVTANDGECSTSVTIDASCGTNISITPSESQTANSSESGTHNYTVTWSGSGSSCVSDLNLAASYNCPTDVVCPASADISTSLTEVCSGESITISGTSTGEGSANFTITSSGIISAISEGVAFSMPENNTCDPVTYTFNATATCADDGSEITNGTLNVEVTVYPSDISAFVTANDGECSTDISIDESCGTNISISPSESQTANPGESGIHNYNASWTGGGPNCVTNLPLTPAYNCVVCPTEASISISETEVCSGESVVITGTTLGEGSASFVITDESGSITEITKGVVFNMPANVTCAPVIYTFTAVSVCDDDGSEIPGSSLSVDVTVYPTQIVNFLSITKGDCSTSVTIDPSCASNVSVTPSASQSANAGESGTHEYTFSWIGDGPNCVPDETLIGNYDCPADVVCPAQANISVSETDICSGEMIAINGEIAGVGGASFTITESSGTISAISEGVSFALPENNTCSPITYTFNATATCNDDGSAITEGNLNLEITVYPANISAFVSSNDGECSTSVTVDASCGTNISISPSENQMANPNESGTHNYTVSWANGPSCISDIDLTANYNCPPDIEELGAISGFVGEDVNNDDLPDQPIVGVTMELYDVSGALLATTTTDTNGDYTFTDLPAGDYVVAEIQPAPFVDVTEGDVSPDATDSTNAPDAPLDNQLFVALAPGEIDDGNNFVEELLGSISGNVGEDIDNNDTPDQPIPGVTINLLNSSGQVLATTTTDANGDYIFPDLPAGDYIVEEIQPLPYSSVSEGPSFPAPTYPYPFDNMIPVTLGPGENSTGNDFVEELLGAISGIVGEDVNNDDLPEQPIDGVTINLLVDYGTLVLIASTTTDANGDYIFPDLPAGTYIIEEVQPSDSNGNLYIDVIEGDADPDDFVNDQTPYPDTILDNQLTVTLNPGEFDEGNNFIEELSTAVCPAEATISADVTEICSAGSITIMGSSLGETEVMFAISESSGNITGITEGEQFNLPENLTCNPITYTFEATATCSADGSEITNGNLSVDVIVYPADISAFVTANDGDCSTSISIDASCGNNITVSPALNQTANPGELGTHEYTVNWTGGGLSCFADEMLVANYNCPTEIVCPTSANIVVNTNEVCSGETVVVSGTYEGEGAATYTITETSGAISEIESGVALSLPENNTCVPVAYTFELTVAACVADGSSISINQSTVEVIVYPSDISSYISSVGNNCMTTVNIASICEDNVFVFPEGGQPAPPGSEAGIHTYVISWNSGSTCEMNTEINVDYTCDCVFDPELAEIELVSGSPNICFGESIGYKAMYDGIDRDLEVEGGIDESYAASFIIFIEPIDFVQPPTTADALYRVTNETMLTNDESIAPGTYYIYYFQGLDTNDPIGDEAMCKLYSQDFLEIEILPEVITSDETFTCDCIFEPELAEIELISGSPNICFGESIEYKAMYDGIDRDLLIEGGLDDSYAASFIIFIEPIDFVQPPTTADALYRVTNETTLTNDESIPPGTYYLYYFQGLDTDDPIGDEAMCKLYSQDFLKVEILPEVESDEAYTCDCIFDPALTEIEIISGSTEVCFGGSIEYKAIYDGIDRDLEVDGGVDDSYAASFIIFIEPIDFVQPPTTTDALYRVTNETTLTNDESIPPGTYYLYYFQGQNTDDPIGDEALCKLYSQDFLVVEVLPEITSGEVVCTGYNNSNEVTISVADGGGSAIPNVAYVENNGIQYAYNSIEVVDTTKILTFSNLPDGYYFFYYEDAQSCSSTDLLTEFNCASQPDDCPTDVSIGSIETAQCSEATISLDVDITGPAELVTINWYDEDGNLVENPGSVNLPLNEGCDPIEITYKLEATCFFIFLDEVTITIYPTDISAFVTPFSDGCTAGVSTSDDCSIGTLGTSSITVPPGNSGTTDILVNYSGNPCFEYFPVTVSYDCIEISGCTDPCAPNYNPDANVYISICQPYTRDCNDDCTTGDLTIWDEATCSCISIETIEGCTDIQACNYNATANCEDLSCQYVSCNRDACMGDIEMVDPANTCNCIVVETQNVGCDDPTALNYDATVNCADNSTCAYVSGAPSTITISELCYCNNEQNIDLDGDGNIDLVAEVITISGSIGDRWILSSNGIPPALDAQNVALLTDGSVVVPEVSPGVYMITIYHPANGTGYGTLVFGRTFDEGSIEVLEISNTDGCACDVECAPPSPGNFECDE